jgi:predicted ABC-type sugar transport system permease subunit
MDFWLGGGLLCAVPFNMLVALGGVISGWFLLKRGTGDRSRATAGIVLGGLAILLDLACTVLTGVFL